MVDYRGNESLDNKPDQTQSQGKNQLYLMRNSGHGTEHFLGRQQKESTPTNTNLRYFNAHNNVNNLLQSTGFDRNTIVQ